jgi:Ca-activated chloride channel family protein
VRAGIGPLIRRLRKEEVKRVRAALAEALFRTTGMSFDDFDDVWARWWKEQGKRFQVPAAIPRRKPRPPGGTTAAFFGLPLDSGRVIFVIDRSGSMSAEDAKGRSRLQTAVQEVLGAVGRLKPADKVNVIFFESTIRAWKRKLTALKPAARADLRRHLEAQAPAGGTNLYDGLELALADPEVDTIFLLSDGMPGAGKFVTTADIVREVARANQARRIAIHCVSVGTDSHLLKQLAASSGGRYVRR